MQGRVEMSEGELKRFAVLQQVIDEARGQRQAAQVLSCRSWEG